MLKWQKHPVCISLVLVLCSAPAARSEAQKVNEFDLGSRDRKVLFDLATTPGGDALSLVAKDTGDWELYRVSDWLSPKPKVERLVLHGYFSKKDSRRNEKPLEQLSARIFVTSDGKYAVCVASAEWLKRVRGWAVGSATSGDIISTVDLSTFKVVATTQTEDMNLFEFHGVDLDAEGRIRVSSLAPNGKVGSFKGALPSGSKAKKATLAAEELRDLRDFLNSEPVQRLQDSYRGPLTSDGGSSMEIELTPGEKTKHIALFNLTFALGTPDSKIYPVAIHDLVCKIYGLKQRAGILYRQAARGGSNETECDEQSLKLITKPAP